MLGFEQVMLQCRIERGTLERWITLSWVRPMQGGGEWQFSDTDIARIELICDLHRDLGIAEDAIEVILPLLDQVYAWLLPVVTAAFVTVALLVWKRGVRNYSSTGT